MAVFFEFGFVKTHKMADACPCAKAVLKRWSKKKPYSLIVTAKLGNRTA